MFDADATVAQMRVPPQSVAAEQAVIGGLLLYPEAWRKIEGSLEPGDFYRRDHQLIFTAIRDMVERDRPFDAVTLGEWFQAQGMGEQVPDHYLTTLASTTPSAANIAGYAKVVSDKALARRMVSIGTEIADAAYDPRFEPEEAGKSIFLRNDYAHMALRDREGDLPEAPEPDRPAPRAGGKSKFFGGGRRGGFGDQD